MLRSLSAGFGLSCLVASALLPASEAAAQEAVFPSPGVFSILPPGELVGDGQSGATVHVLALDPDGKPMIGLMPRISVSDGSVQGWKELGGGLYSFSLVPPRVDAAQDITLRVRGRTLEREELSAELVVPVRAAPATRLALASNSDRGMLGLDVEVGLTLSVTGTMEPEDLLVSASAGEVVDLKPVSPGKYSARYLLPKVNFPQIALITVADRRSPGRVYSHLALPLYGRTDYPVKTSPGASVVLKVGGRQFGPAVAAADGRVRVPIVVPPGVQQGMIVTTENGQVTESALDLRIPETRRLELFPGATSLPAESTVTVPVRVAVRTGTGEPDSSARPQFTASAGSFGEPRHEGGGVYVADYTAPDLTGPTPATLRVALPGSSIQVDSREVQLLPALPARLSLTTDPAVLGAGQTAFKATASLFTMDQTGIPGRQVVMDGYGAKPKAQPVDLRNGSYRAEFGATGIGAVEVLAVPSLPPSTNPVDRVLLVSEQGSVVNDGVGGAVLAVIAVDAYGMPVPGVKIALRSDGDGSVPAEVVTDASGVAFATYAAGKRAGVVTIEAVAGGHRDAVGLVQAPSGPASLPESGDAKAVALAGRWGGLVARATPSQGTGVGGSSTAPAGARVERFDVRAEPSSAAPGGTVMLRIRALDEQNRGVAGRKLEVIASGAKVGAVRDLGGGAYEVAVAIFADATGESKVAVGAVEGGAGYVLKIPISGAPAATPWGETTADAAPPVAPATDAKPAQSKRAPGDRESPRRMVVSYSGSSYAFEQTPVSEDGPLLPGAFRVGGEGQANAVSSGVLAEVSSDLGRFARVQFAGRFERYAIAADIFAGQTVSDWLVDGVGYAVARVPVSIGASRLEIGGRGGFRYGDVLVYKGCLEDGCVISYDTIALPGATTGAELAFSSGDFSVRGGWELSLLGATPYRQGFDARVGYDWKGLLLQAGLDRATRTVTIVGDESGAVYGDFADQRTMWSVGVGYEF